MAGTDGESLPFVIRDMTAVEERAVAAWPYEGSMRFTTLRRMPTIWPNCSTPGNGFGDISLPTTTRSWASWFSRPPRGHRVDRLGPTARPDG